MLVNKSLKKITCKYLIKTLIDSAFEGENFKTIG